MRDKKTRLRTGMIVLAGALVLFNAQSASAKNTEAPSPVSIKVKGVTGDLQLYKTITVEVENLSGYLKQTGKDAGKFILYLDWRPLKKVNARMMDGTDKLQFDIRRTPDSEMEWNALLGLPFAKDKGFTYLVPVSIGYENENPIPSDVQYLLIVTKKIWLWIFAAFFVLALGVFLRLARASGIIRDPSPDLPPQERPYSLGRTQMAFWYFLVVVSYVFIWMITSDLDSLTGSALALIGISTVTGLSASYVGEKKLDKAVNRRKKLEKEKAALQAGLSDLGARVALASSPENMGGLRIEEAETKVRLVQVDQEIQGVTAMTAPRKSEGFLNDILADADGISLHRFQIAVWTIVRGFIFATSIYNSLAMPQFSDTLLALMGISSGTYIGFKFPEKQV